MTRTNPPPIEFTHWVSWADRGTLRRADGPWLGLYLWARFDRAPSQSTKPYPSLPEQLIYIGETKHLDLRPLAGRHHRLAHYRDTFPDDRDLQRLYISVCHLYHFKDGYKTAAASALYANLRVYTQHIEAQLYWEYTRRWGRPPALHYKKGRKDADVM